MLTGVRVVVWRVSASKLMLNGLSPSEREGSAASHLYEKLIPKSPYAPLVPVARHSALWRGGCGMVDTAKKAFPSYAHHTQVPREGATHAKGETAGAQGRCQPPRQLAARPIITQSYYPRAGALGQGRATTARSKTRKIKGRHAGRHPWSPWRRAAAGSSSPCVMA